MTTEQWLDADRVTLTIEAPEGVLYRSTLTFAAYSAAMRDGELLRFTFRPIAELEDVDELADVDEPPRVFAALRVELLDDPEAIAETIAAVGRGYQLAARAMLNGGDRAPAPTRAPESAQLADGALNGGLELGTAEDGVEPGRGLLARRRRRRRHRRQP